jgi:hypothetical protein
MSDLTLLSSYLRRDDFASGDLSQLNFGRVVQAGALALLGLACSSGKGDLQSEQQKAEIALFQSEVKDATPVQLGVLTPTQRIHSKLFSLYPGVAQEQTLAEAAASAKAKGKLTTGLGLFPHLPSWGRKTAKEYFKPLVRDSDIVIRGTVTKKASQFTESEKFIFTDYEILITEVMKGDRREVIAGKTITVTRPGGKVLLDGILVTASVSSFKPLPVNGREVVLLLQKISESGAYKATHYDGSIEIEGDRADERGLLPNQWRDSIIPIIRALSAKY